MIDLAKYSNMRICAAVSGGKDSMALLSFLHAHMHEYGITLSALNCDHKIRGEASARDSKFVIDFCVARHIPVIFFEWGSTPFTSENAARLWRLGCYASATKKFGHEIKPTAVYSDKEWEGADAIATAHHLNDNAETVLFNLARGTALSGMEGICDYSFPDGTGGTFKIIHPMITLSRAEIDGYIAENNIPFVEDESNFSDDYTRNKIRHSVLPELEKAVPGATKAIYRFSRLAADDEEFFDELITSRRLISKTRHGYEISHCKEKVVFKRAVVKVIASLNLKDYTSDQVQRLYDLQFAEKGKKFEFLGYTAFKESGKIAILSTALLNSEKDGILFFEHFENEYSFWNDSFIYISDGKGLGESLLAFEAAAEDDKRMPKKYKVLKFDPRAIPATARIRFMREGDRFTKFGGGTKSLGDYFTDKKIPVRIRKRVPLIVDGHEVLAVGGVEISDKIKLTESTDKISYLICEDYTI